MELKLEKYQNNPDAALIDIQNQFYVYGKQYRQGLTTEEEFYRLTDYSIIFPKLLEMKNKTFIDTLSIQQHDDFLPSWNYWKRTGHTKISPWMYSGIYQNGNLLQSAEWIFQVMDVLKVPAEMMVGLPRDILPVLPDTIFGYVDDNVAMAINEICLDASKLYRSVNPLGKEFVFHFNSGTIATVKIAKKDEAGYIGEGIIDGYMEKSGKIKIEKAADNRIYFWFNEKRGVTGYKRTLGSFFYPIPHPQWKEYEEIRLARAMRIECEYKTLRLPYLLGISPEGPGKKPKKASIHKMTDTNIIHFPLLKTCE